MKFQTSRAPDAWEPAPDGSTIFPLVRTDRASVGLIELSPGACSGAVVHLTVEEIWYVLGGSGQIWRSGDTREQITDLTPGTCITIPTGAAFQFRSTGITPLRMLMVTMPPWPGMDEARLVEGYWKPDR